MLHVISDRRVARELHTITLGATLVYVLETVRGVVRDCQKSRFAPLNAIIIIIIIMDHLNSSCSMDVQSTYASTMKKKVKGMLLPCRCRAS